MKMILSLVFCLFIFRDLVLGDLILTQVQVQPSTEWEVKGLASYEYDGCCPRIFHFHCTSTINNGNGLNWQKKGSDLTKSQNIITNGVSLVFTSPTQTDAGIYICSDSASSDSVELNITTDNPAAQAIVKTMTAVVGDSVTIEFYASSIPAPQAANITWRLDGVEITSGDFENNKKKLTISQVNLADSGVYKFIIARKSGGFTVAATAETRLNISVPPSILTHPSNISDIEEWKTVKLTCTVTGTPPITINWFKVGGAIPSEATQSTNIINSTVNSSTLTLSNIRIAYSGQYYCKASFSDGTHPTQSNIATVSINGGLRFVYISSSDQSVILSSPLLYVNNVSFNLSCEGSGSLVWIKSNGVNVSKNITDVPYQETQPLSLFQSLVFNSYSSLYSGLYTCSSHLQVVKSVFITNSNPAIYTTQSMIRVGIMTNTSLTVYTSGQDPTPTANDLSWYFQGTRIDPASNPHYQIQNNNAVLTIIAPSANVTGQYEARVSTSQGTNSVFINVSYHDPPVITIDPNISQKIIVTGESVSFSCNATGDLEVTLWWQYEESDLLPSGVMINGHTLIIQDASNSQSGIYQCVANDGVSTVKKSIELLVKYSPIVGVGKVPINTLPSLNETIIEGMTPPPIFFCTGTGYPTPTLSWEYKGNQTLPSDVVQHEVNGHLQLRWNRPILYSDEGTYTCRARNELNTTIAKLIIKVNATPIIYSIYPTYPVMLTETTPLTFACPISHTKCTLTCVARGWPVPSLYWLDTENNNKNPSYIIRQSGVVIAVLEWNGNQSLTQYRCQASNMYGTSIQTVQVVAMTTSKPQLPVPAVPDSTSVKLRFRINTTVCSQQIDSSLIEQIKTSLVHIMVSRCQSCENATSALSIPQTGCDPSLPEATIFVITISTSSIPLTAKVYNTLAEWWTTGPSIYFNNTLHILDQDCNLLVQGSDSNLICSIIPMTSSSYPTSTTTTGPSSTSGNDVFQILWAVVVAVIAALCLVVIVTLIVVLGLCIRTVKRDRNGDRGHGEVAWSSNDSTLKTWRTGSTMTTNMSSSQQLVTFPLHSTSDENMFDNPEYTQSNLIRQVQRVSANIEQPPENSNFRQLQTTPTNDVDSPSPSTQSEQSIQITQQSTQLSSEGIQAPPPYSTIHEALYQRSQPEDRQYAKIRSSAQLESSPTRRVVQVGVQNNSPYEELDELHQMSASLRSSSSQQQPPTSPQYSQPILSSSSQPDHTMQPLGTGGVFMSRHRGMSTPTIGPIPYSEPVSSLGNLRGTHQTLPPIRMSRGDPRLINRAISSPLVQQNPSNDSSPSNKRQLPPVIERAGGHFQPWYNDSESDIVTPTIHNPNFDISPYAITPSSQIEPCSQNSMDGQSTASSQTSSLPPNIMKPGGHYRTYEV